MKKRVALNYIYSALYQIILIIVPFITAPYLARTLLPDAVGINSYVSAVVSTFSLVGLIGLNNYSIREIAYVRNDEEKLSKSFSELLVLRVICFAITLVAYVIFALMSEYRLYFLVQLIAILSAFLDISWLYAGLEEFKVTVTRSFIVKIVNVISIFVFIHSPNDLCLFMILSTIYTVIGNSILYLGIKKRIKKFVFTELNITRHIIPTLKLFLPQVASTVFLQIDKIMIKWLAPAVSSVGFYDQAERIVKMPLALITALSVVMLPRISNEFKHNNIEKIKNYIFKSFEFSLFLAIPLMFGLMVISSTMIPWFLGKGYEGVISIMFTLSPVVVFISLSSVSGKQYLTATNKTKILTISYLAGAFIDLVLNYILIPKIGAVGAAIGTLCAETVVFMIQMIYIKDILEFKKLIKQFTKYTICGCIMFCACYYVGDIYGNTVISTLLQIILGGIVYFALLFVLKDRFMFDCIKRGKIVLINKFKKMNAKRSVR